MDNSEDDGLAGSSGATETRRALLRASLGGVALAASGLFLPVDDADDAAAREGAYGGVLGGRHGRNRRGRDTRKRRDHGEKKDHPGKRRGKRNAPGSGGNGQKFLDVTIGVYNFRSVDVQVQGWQDRPDPRFDDPWYMKDESWDWSTIPAKPANGLAHYRDFDGDRWNLSIRIGDDRVVSVQGGEGLPAGYILSGGWDGKWGWNPTGLYLAQDGRMEVGDSISHSGITLSRHRDSPAHMNFLVDLT